MGDRGIRITKQTIKSIITMHEKGETLGFVAKENGVHRDTVKSYLKRFNRFKKTFVLETFLKGIDE